MYHKNQPNVGEQTIHGSYGSWVWALGTLFLKVSKPFQSSTALQSSDLSIFLGDCFFKANNLGIFSTYLVHACNLKLLFEKVPYYFNYSEKNETVV